MARGNLLARLGRLIDLVRALPAAVRFVAHLNLQFPSVLSFLWDPSVDCPTRQRHEDLNDVFAPLV